MPTRPRTRRARRRRALRVVLLVIATLATLVAAVLAWIAFGDLPRYDEIVAPEVSIVIDDDATRERLLARGRKVVAGACRRCHAGPAGGPLTGRAMRELPSRLGAASATNLTAHPRAGIGGWSDTELALLLRGGIDKEHVWVPPTMPRFTRMSSDDLDATLVFLRSDHPWVIADAAQPPASAPSLWVKLHARYDWLPPQLPSEAVPAPSRDEPRELGRYLVEDLLQCNGCHGSGPESLALEHPIDDPEFLGGGQRLLDRNGEAIYAANITFDPVHGIANWSYEEFRRALVEGFGPDGELVRWPMPRYGELDDTEVAAIYAYLSAAPQVARALPESADYLIPGTRLDPGKHVFFRAGCHYCHGRDPAELRAWAQGLIDHFADDATLAAYIADPRQFDPEREMPGFAAVLSEADRLAVAAHVRSLVPTERR
ncbi:MAG: hypothetical protein IPN32_11030 [Deltaproteobacteria bacterium]|nr:hypothetical protein [Deltaproteobacteria bacterium]